MTDPAPRYFTPKEAADYLRVSKWSIYKLIERRRIPFIPLAVDPGEGKKNMVRLDRIALDRWMEQQAITPPAPH